MKICVIGGGKSAFATVKLAHRLGYQLFVSNMQSKDKALDIFNFCNNYNIDYEFDGHTDKCYENVDIMVISPGIPPHAPVVTKAEEHGIKIISELEFAFIHKKEKSKVIAITGTNGKTTTTSLIEYIFQQSGKNAIACGNIGLPLSDLVLDSDENTYFIVETSSYQLDRIENFRPDVAIILNITPDHLAYHGSFEQYVEAKWKISTNLQSDNLLILNLDDEIIINKSKYLASGDFSQVVSPIIQYFSLNEKFIDGAWIDNHTICVSNSKHKEEIMQSSGLALPGRHNLYNSMAAILAARHFEIRNEDIRDALSSFSGVEHRLEEVRTISGIKFINDSKATNINAAWYALSSYSNDIIWIAGGQGDNNNYSELDDLIINRVRQIIAIGDDQNKIISHFSKFVSCYAAENLSDAVNSAYEVALDGDVVLFSPACKSFDMFVNYEHRGSEFKKFVELL